MRHLVTLIAAHLWPELYEAPDSELVVPVAGVAALGFLVSCTHGGQTIPLVRAACLQSEVKINGYSKVSLQQL